MALYPSTRVSLKFNDINNYACWFLVDHQKMPSVSQLQQQINNRFYHNIKGKITLTLKGSLIPSWESSLILRDDDQIVSNMKDHREISVQKENDIVELKSFVNKKKKKLNSSLKANSKNIETEINTKANDVIFISEEKSNFLDNSKNECSIIKMKNKTKKRKCLGIKEKKEVVEYLEIKEGIEERSGKKEKKIKKGCLKEKEKTEEIVHLGKRRMGKKELPVKKRKKEIEICEEEDPPPLLIVESKKKRKRKSEMCDIPEVKLVFEDNSEELVEKEQKKHEKRHRKLHKLSKNQSSNCDQLKEIVIDDDDDQKEVVEVVEDNQGSNSDLDKEIIIDDDDDDNNRDNGDVENSDVKITSVVSHYENRNSQETLRNSDPRNEPKSSQNEVISLSTISPISKAYEERNTDSFINSDKKNSTEISNIPVKEAVEVFSISNENLTAICKAVEDGESLTIRENQARKIELCPNTNENSPNTDNNNVSNEKLPVNRVTEKNGSKPHRTRRHRRRHRGPSFACAPFIQAMSSHSETDTPILMSTLKTTTPQQHSGSLHSSQNYSDKHIHFDSDEEAEGSPSNIDPTNGESEPDRCISTSFNSLKTENLIIQSPCLENPLVPETSKPQTNLDNSLLFSVRAALQKNCAVYQRGSSPVKLPQFSPSSVNVHSDKQEIKTYSKNIQSRNTNPTHFNTFASRPNYDALPSLSGTPGAGDRIAFKNPTHFNTFASRPNYEALPSLSGTPSAGDSIAFKRLEIGFDYSPVISVYRKATVLAFEGETKRITLKFHTSPESKRTGGKFELCFENENNTGDDEIDDDIETVLLSTLMDVKLLSKS